MDVDGGGNKRVFNRLGGSSTEPRIQNQKVCFHWKAGKCNRYPCPYLHRDLPTPPTQSLNGTISSKRHNAFSASMGEPSVPRRAPNTWGRHQNNAMGNRVVKKLDKVCTYFLQGNCGYGEKCKYLHVWSLGESFTALTLLEGHQKVI